MQQQVLTSTHLIQCIVWLRFTYMDIAKEKCLLLIQSVQKQNQLSKKKISILIKCELNRMHTNARKDQAHKLKCKKVQLLLLYTKPLLLHCIRWGCMRSVVPTLRVGSTAVIPLCFDRGKWAIRQRNQGKQYIIYTCNKTHHLLLLPIKSNQTAKCFVIYHSSYEKFNKALEIL